MDPMKKRALLMEHATHPRHYRKEERYVSVRAYSHTCADDLTLMVNIQDDVIEDVCFYGHACAIATAAASMMCMFIATGIAKIPLSKSMKAMIPFVTAEIIVLFLITYIPELCLTLPRILGLW